MAQYNRVAACEEIRHGCPWASWHYAQRGTTYDCLLVLQGCRICCADLADLQARHGSIQVVAKSDIMNAIRAITQYRSEQT